MNQELELELTYLAKEIPNEIQNIQPTRIIDLYIPDTVEHAHLRLRQKAKSMKLLKRHQLSKVILPNRSNKPFHSPKKSLKLWLPVARKKSSRIAIKLK